MQVPSDSIGDPFGLAPLSTSKLGNLQAKPPMTNTAKNVASADDCKNDAPQTDIVDSLQAKLASSHVSAASHKTGQYQIFE